MTMLFRGGPLLDKLKGIAKLTWLHGKNLGSFVFIYKAITYLLAKTSPLGGGTGPPGTPMNGWHAAVAGWIGGYFIWGKYNSVNYQIVLYLFSRIIMALFRVIAARGVQPFASFSFPQLYPYLAATVWAVVMSLFETNRWSLHKSLSASMDFLYHDSNSTTSASDFVMPWPTAAVLLAHWYFESMASPKAGVGGGGGKSL